jgi:hypothetical protein
MRASCDPLIAWEGLNAAFWEAEGAYRLNQVGDDRNTDHDSLFQALDRAALDAALFKHRLAEVVEDKRAIANALMNLSAHFDAHWGNLAVLVSASAGETLRSVNVLANESGAFAVEAEWDPAVHFWRVYMTGRIEQIEVAATDALRSDPLSPAEVGEKARIVAMIGAGQICRLILTTADVDDRAQIYPRLHAWQTSIMTLPTRVFLAALNDPRSADDIARVFDDAFPLGTIAPAVLMRWCIDRAPQDILDILCRDLSRFGISASPLTSASRNGE